MRHKAYGTYEKFIKRPLDCILATGAFVLFSPIMGVTAIAVRKNIGKPVLFFQERPGKDEKIFKLYKFRSMTDERDADGELLPDEIRLTKFGKFLRSTSLDELPELLNIIKGDMAIVGPRPLLPEYLPYYTEEESLRHNVRPGLTGLAQVNGRSFISWEDIFAYDIDYVRNITFVNDIKIVLKTIEKVFARKGIADVSEGVKDEDGRYHYIINGRDVVLHNPLNIEREKENAERNR